VTLWACERCGFECAAWAGCERFPLCTACERTDRLARAGVTAHSMASSDKLRAIAPGGNCPACESSLLTIRVGKFGRFIGCLAFPRCRFTSRLPRALRTAA